MASFPYGTGLKNRNGQCYFNTTIQCLANVLNTIPLSIPNDHQITNEQIDPYDIFRLCQSVRRQNVSVSFITRSTNAYEVLMGQSESIVQRITSTDEYMSTFAEGQYQDVHECFLFLMKVMHRNPTISQELDVRFYNMYITERRCTMKNHLLSVVPSFKNNLDIKFIEGNSCQLQDKIDRTLIDPNKTFMDPCRMYICQDTEEIVETFKGLKTTKRKSVINTTSSSKLMYLSMFLIVYINRKKANGSSHKNECRGLNSLTFNEYSLDGTTSSKITYDLISSSNHESDHYTSYVKFNNGTIVRYNDGLEPAWKGRGNKSRTDWPKNLQKYSNFLVYQRHDLTNITEERKWQGWIYRIMQDAKPQPLELKCKNGTFICQSINASPSVVIVHCSFQEQKDSQTQRFTWNGLLVWSFIDPNNKQYMFINQSPSSATSNLKGLLNMSNSPFEECILSSLAKNNTIIGPRDCSTQLQTYLDHVQRYVKMRQRNWDCKLNPKNKSFFFI